MIQKVSRNLSQMIFLLSPPEVPKAHIDWSVKHLGQTHNIAFTFDQP